MVKVSVIVPVYNVEKYLKPCINSLLSQTLQDVEFIFVDDGSTDHSVQIIKEYKKKDERIKLIQQKNRFAGVARNTGLEAAVGEYVVFLDSDDYFEPDMLLEMYQKCVMDAAQICLCSGRVFNEITGEQQQANHYLNLEFLPEQTPFSASDIALRLFNAIAPNPWTKMFLRSYLMENEFRFQGTKKSNDLFFVYSALAGADSITYVDREFVNYRSGNANSLQGNKSELNFDFYKALLALKDFLLQKKLYQKFGQSFCNRALSSCLYALDNCCVESNFITMVDRFRQTIFYKLDILGHSSGYFYIKKDFGRMIDILQNDANALWEEKNAPRIEEIDLVPPHPDLSGWKSRIALTDKPDVKLSVIIPVYNVEQYIETCLDSVLNNTLKDIEILCIDDGSTDSSPAILQRYADQDSRIKIITVKNGGPSRARNMGIRAAEGEYIFFLDSDDYIEPRMLEYLYCEAKADDLDQLFFGARIFYDKEDEQDAVDSGLNYTRKVKYNGIMTGRQMFEIMSENGDFKPSECLQFIKRSLLINNSVYFAEGVLYEDNAFTIECLSLSSRVRHVDLAFYNRRIRKNSIMTGIIGIQSAFNYYLVLHKIEEIAEKRNFSSDPAFYFALLMQMKRMCSTASDKLIGVEDDEFNDFLLTLKEKTAVDFFCQIKLLHDARASAKMMAHRAKLANEQKLTNDFKWKCSLSELKIEKQKAQAVPFIGKLKRKIKKIIKL